MDLELKDKVALVTGGASGIGAAIAVALAREGCDIAIVDRRTTGPLAAICALGRRARLFIADVRDHAETERVIDAVVEEFGRIDILVCDAGITADATIFKMTEDQWDDVIAVNLKGYFNYNQAVARRFRDQKSGRIVNVASINGLRGKFGQANYAASKGGVVALTKTLARELGKFGVNANVVAPGLVSTPMVRSMPPETVAAAVRETLVGRMAEPEDCAAAIVFLCSEVARHVTGQVLRVDGGQYL